MKQYLAKKRDFTQESGRKYRRILELAEKMYKVLVSEDNFKTSKIYGKTENVFARLEKKR